MAKVTVVVPYFQRESGILQRALLSVLRQDGGHVLDVIVVDDGSPAPADDEIHRLPHNALVTVRVIKKTNGGPAAARNVALNQVASDTDFIAFLDSDDEWLPSHVHNAVRALGDDFDFYFADFYQLDQTVSAFDRRGRLELTRHKHLTDPFYAYMGDMFRQILTGNVIGTSTVVYRLSTFRDLRFREEFYSAGEDYLFWMDCARRSDRIVFSTQVECRYGRGVNVYSGSGWGTDGHAKRISDELRYRKAIGKVHALSAADASFVKQKVSELREAYARDFLHRLVHRRPIDRTVMTELVRSDPAMRFLLLPLVLKLGVQSAAGRLAAIARNTSTKSDS